MRLRPGWGTSARVHPSLTVVGGVLGHKFGYAVLQLSRAGLRTKVFEPLKPEYKMNYLALFCRIVKIATDKA